MSIFRPPLDETAGFLAFKELVDTGQAVAFPWGLKIRLSFLASLNPFSYRSIYRKEEQMAMEGETQKRLFDFLVRQEATCVIGHSLGCRLIYETLKRYGLPKTLQRVVWVQAGMDVPSSVQHSIPHLIHFWCPWDPTLLASAFFIHFSSRAGLVPIRGATNVLVPLWRIPNLHTSSQRDRQLLKWCV